MSDDDAELMPPAESNKKLTGDEITLMRRWIAQGASWEQHWSFLAPRGPDLPAVMPISPVFTAE